MVRLLAIDMDGTCLNDRHQISDPDMKALRMAAEAGIVVVPATGRAARCLPRQLMKENFYRYLISSNGADVADLKENCSLYHALIPSDRAAEVLREACRIRLGLSVHAMHQFLIQGVGLNILGRICYGKDAQNSGYSHDLIAYLEKNQENVEEIQLFYFSESKRKAAVTLLEKFPDLTVAYDRFYAEVYAGDTSKGNALAALERHLQIPAEQVACIGDAENDLSMFRSAGVKFAMGNGISALKKEADVVLPDHNHSGVAVAIKEYLLK